jgi:ABC transporter substrate binding protein
MSGHPADVSQRQSLTQQRHRRPKTAVVQKNAVHGKMSGAAVLGLRPIHEATRVHHTAWRRGSGVATAIDCPGPNIVDEFRQAAGYIDRTLRGEKPASMPVQAPAKYDLVININTAKALGIAVPQLVLARADEVIE